MVIDISTIQCQIEKHTCCAKFDGTIVGSASILIDRKEHGKPAGLIEDVAVMVEYRNFGIGGSLVNKLVEIAREEGCYKVCFVCRSHNIHFYEGCGFQLDSQFAMRMNLSLEVNL